MKPEVSAALRERIAADPFCQFLGIALDEIRPGYARLSMTVTAAMLNFHGTGHGGMVYTLADAAHAAASNSHGDPAVAVHLGFHYLAPARAGQRLVAEASEESRSGRTGLYHLVVRDAANGEMLAAGQGRVHIKRPS